MGCDYFQITTVYGVYDKPVKLNNFEKWKLDDDTKIVYRQLDRSPGYYSNADEFDQYRDHPQASVFDNSSKKLIYDSSGSVGDEYSKTRPPLKFGGATLLRAYIETANCSRDALGIC